MHLRCIKIVRRTFLAAGVLVHYNSRNIAGPENPGFTTAIVVYSHDIAEHMAVLV